MSLKNAPEFNLDEFKFYSDNSGMRQYKHGKKRGRIHLRLPAGLTLVSVSSRGTTGVLVPLEIFEQSATHVQLLAHPNFTYLLTFRGQLAYHAIEHHVTRKVKNVDSFTLVNYEMEADIAFCFDKASDMNFQGLFIGLTCNGQEVLAEPSDITYDDSGRMYIYYGKMPQGKYKLHLRQSDAYVDTTINLGDGRIVDKNHVVKLALRCGFKLEKQPNGTYGLNSYVFDFAFDFARQMKDFL